MAEENIWFVFGPSGVGKSEFSKWVTDRNKWLFYEIDLAGHDGIDHAGLRREWDSFLNAPPYSCQPLIDRIRERFTCCKGAVLSFSSLIIFDETRLSYLRGAGVKIVYLYGSREHCKKAFDDREKAKPRTPPLAPNHWEDCNAFLFPVPPVVYRPYVHECFQPDGKRMDSEVLYNSIAKG